MEVFPGGSRYLKALPGVRRAPVHQLRPSYGVLSWDADLPVTIDHKLGATVLEGLMREDDEGGQSLALISVDKRVEHFKSPPLFNRVMLR